MHVHTRVILGCCKYKGNKLSREGRYQLLKSSLLWFLWKKTLLRSWHLSTDFKKEQTMWTLQESQSGYRQRHSGKMIWNTEASMGSQCDAVEMQMKKMEKKMKSRKGTGSRKLDHIRPGCFSRLLGFHSERGRKP